MQDDWVRFLAVLDIQVVAGSHENFQYVRTQSAYTELIDRMVFAVDPDSTSIGAYDPCGSPIWPIATGSELTTYYLSPQFASEGGYGMRIEKNALLQSTAWLWKNPGNVEQADVYIEFTLQFDMVDEPGIPEERRIDVHISWISAGCGCGYELCLDPSQTTATKLGSPYALSPRYSTKIVAAVPLTLDHTASMQLYRKRGNQYMIIHQNSVATSNNYVSGTPTARSGRRRGVAGLPGVGEPVVEVAGLRLGEVGEQLREVALRVDVVAAAGACQTGENGTRPAATRATHEQTVPAIEHDAFHLALARVVINRHSAILGEHCQRLPLVQRILRRLGHRVPGKQLITPDVQTILERVQHRPRLALAKRQTLA